jgi:hypothetical protein
MLGHDRWEKAVGKRLVSVELEFEVLWCLVEWADDVFQFICLVDRAYRSSRNLPF